MYKILAFIFSVFLISGCDVTPLYTINPKDEPIHWQNGTAYIDAEEYPISISAGYIDRCDGCSRFNVIIKNIGDRPLLIDPALFSCDTYAKRKIDTLLYQQTTAVNPETKLLDIEKAYNDEEAHYKTTVGINGVVSLFQVVTDIVSIGKQCSQEERESIDKNSRDIENQRASIESDHAKNIESLRQSKEYWQHEALRKTTLQPGDAIEGRVHFSAVLMPAIVLVHVPCEDTQITMRFEQLRSE